VTYVRDWCFIGRKRIRTLRLLLPYTFRVPLNYETKAYVDTMARRYGVSGTDVLLRALFTFRYLNGVLEQDGVLIIERVSGEVETIVKI